MQEAERKDKERPIWARAEAENPWATPKAMPVVEPVEQPDAEQPARPLKLPAVTTPGHGERLAQRALTREELLVPLWVTGAHGGAGTTTIATLLGAGDAGSAWPTAPEDDRHPRVLLCARASYSGLRAAQVALREWAAGGVPVELEGVVLAPAAPKFPKELKPFLDRVRAAASGAVWEVGWHEQWLRAEPEMPNDKQLKRLLDQFKTNGGSRK